MKEEYRLTMSIHNCNTNKELRGGYKFEKGIQIDKNIKLSDSEIYRATTAIQDWNLDEEYRTTKKLSERYSSMSRILHWKWDTELQQRY